MKKVYVKPTVTTSSIVVETMNLGPITARVESFRTTKFDECGFGL